MAVKPRQHNKMTLPFAGVGFFGGGGNHLFRFGKLSLRRISISIALISDHPEVDTPLAKDRYGKKAVSSHSAVFYTKSLMSKLPFLRMSGACQTVGAMMA
jgi:hypothetical protein